MTCHEFFVGKIRCLVVSDGSEPSTAAKLADMFPPQPEIQTAFAALPQPIEFAFNCLFIESDGKRMLIDTGEGTLDPSRKTHLLDSLRAADIAPEQIALVVLTHGHSDHIGGVVNGDGQLVFTNARYLMSALDWNYWTGPAMRPISEQCLLPLKDRITLIEPDADIAPGVKAIPAMGHTPGHIAILIESNGEKLIHVVDAIHHPLQIATPRWSPRVDHDPVQSVKTRRELLDLAAREHCRLMAYHFAFPGLGTVSANGDSFQFIPL